MIEILAHRDPAPPLPLQRGMIQILARRDLDREVRRVAPTFNQLRRCRRRLNACATAAPILLALMPQQHEAPGEDVNLLRLLELTDPLVERAAARGADLIGLV